MSKLSNRAMLPIEYMQCKYHGAVIINTDDIVAHAAKEIQLHVECPYSRHRKYSIPFYIPHVSISAVRLSIYSYKEESLRAYEIALHLPFAPEDLALFKTICAYVKQKCSESTRHKQMAFDICCYYRGEASFIPEDMDGKPLLSVFFKSLYKEPQYTFKVDNGSLVFKYTAAQFKPLGDYNQLKNKFFEFIRKHIWLALYQKVNEPCFAHVVKTNGFDTNQWLSVIFWRNEIPFIFSVNSYVSLRASTPCRII